MKKFLVILLLFTNLAVLLPPAFAQRKREKTATTPAALATQRGADQITADQMRGYLSFIASDEMEGRDTPSRGLDTTAKFLAMNLQRWGFKPAGDDGSFFQHIALRRDRVDASQTKVELNGQILAIGEDYLPGNVAGEISGPLVFAGNGWYIKNKGIDSYKDIDATGKIAVIFAAPNANPRSASFLDLGKQGEDWLNPVDNARKHGVVALIYVPDFQYFANWDRNRQRLLDRGATVVEKFMNAAGSTLPTIVISPKIANALFQGERQGATSLFEKFYGGSIENMPEPFLMSAQKKLSLKITVKNEALGTQNVVAIWEGGDPVLKDEYVALGAHYDHIGTTNMPVNGDSVFNGADDDGSGTTALLSMAEALSRNPTRPKRSTLFVWHCGEEKGLWGSRYFTNYPTIPLDHVVAQLNIDMIGRSKKEGDTSPRNRRLTGPNDIYVIGSTMMSTELGEISQSVNKSYLNLTFDLRYDDPADTERLFYRSDHVNYARKGIPIIFFFDGVHEDYHQLGDTSDKIDYEKMVKITRTIYMMLWEISNRPARIKVDKPMPAQLRSAS
ncbi:MAG TPA: M28 family peptidase [Pyrinomonadaceae bacterium]|nr:M28 family peptidase [Pyrinomonadaceae bacterium]